jgi:hypothetical protein
MAGLLITVPLPSKIKEEAPAAVAVKHAEPVRH